MIWPLIQHVRRWLGRSRSALIAGLLLLNLGLLHPLLCVLHCEILLRADQPRHSGHVHAHAHAHSDQHDPVHSTGSTPAALEHPQCEVLPPAVYALILSIPTIVLIVLDLLWRTVSAAHVRAGQILRPPIPPPIALL